jgi:hypothetical protein
MAKRSRYEGCRVALLTQHGKQAVIATLLEPALGCHIELVTGFDTDQLGTFTRETPRPGTQQEAARRKARQGMLLAGTSLGIASEGSFAADPFSGMLPWNVELVTWIDDAVRHRNHRYRPGGGPQGTYTKRPLAGHRRLCRTRGLP